MSDKEKTKACTFDKSKGFASDEERERESKSLCVQWKNTVFFQERECKKKLSVVEDLKYRQVKKIFCVRKMRKPLGFS